MNWIYCSERLPDEEGYDFVFCVHNGKHNGIHAGTYDILDDERMFCDTDHEAFYRVGTGDHEVYAWCKLEPAAYPETGSIVHCVKAERTAT